MGHRGGKRRSAVVLAASAGGRIRRARRRASSLPFVEFEEISEQWYRVADDSLAVYELFVGINASPDFTSPPAATSPTLPFSYSPTWGGTGTLHVVVRLRNKYDLESFNVYETLIPVVAGVPSLGPITAPFDVAVYDRATGYAQVISKYVSTLDLDPADTWEVYAKVGSDPVPGVDTPAYTGLMLFLGVESGVTKLVGPYTAGTVLHVIVSAKRAADGARSSAAVVLHTLAVALGVSDGTLFGGTAFEQE